MDPSPRIYSPSPGTWRWDHVTTLLFRLCLGNDKGHLGPIPPPMDTRYKRTSISHLSSPYCIHDYDSYVFVISSSFTWTLPKKRHTNPTWVLILNPTIMTFLWPSKWSLNSLAWHNRSIMWIFNLLLLCYQHVIFTSRSFVILFI